jgi:hypothetical protein
MLLDFFEAYLGTTTTGAAGATTTGALGATTTGRLTPGATTVGPRATGRRTQAEAGSIKAPINRTAVTNVLRFICFSLQYRNRYPSAFYMATRSKIFSIRGIKRLLHVFKNKPPANERDTPLEKHKALGRMGFFMRITDQCLYDLRPVYK